MIPLALGAAISPALLGLQLVTLSSKVEPLKRSWAVAGGAAAVLLGYSAFAALAAFGTNQGASSPSDVGAILKLAIAVLLLGLGARNAFRAPKPKASAALQDERPHLGRSFALGALLMATNITTLALYLPAVHDIGISDVDESAKAAAFALIFAVTLSPAVAPPLFTALLGQRGTRAIARLGGFMDAHRQAIATLVPIAFAGVLAAQAIPDLI